MLRRLLRTLVVLVAALGILPGSELLIENASELIGHGHFAHSARDKAEPFNAEHGCSPAERNCPCPHAQLTMAQGKAEVAAFPQDHWLTWTLDVERAGRRSDSIRRFRGSDVAPANRSTAPPTPPAKA